uniref:ECF transporter S component n=1 Tax=Motilibacter deserti TaxID=2714956 RepID=UPI0038B24D37
MAVGAGLVTRGVRASRSAAPWRTVDIVVAAVLSVACGVVFWAWAYLWDAVKPAFVAFPPGQALIYGMWFLPAALVPLIVRRPGAAVFAELVAATVEWMLFSQFGPAVIVYGLVQGLLAECAFAATGYRRWTLGVALAAGALAGAGAAPLDWVYSYPLWSVAWKLAYLGIVVVSGALLTGLLSWYAVRALAPTGALSAFAAGRERELV